MKKILTGLILLLSLTISGQQMSWDEWEKAAQSDIRLLPK